MATAKKKSGRKDLDPVSKYTADKWFGDEGLLFPDPTFVEYDLKRWTRTRFVNFHCIFIICDDYCAAGWVLGTFFFSFIYFSCIIYKICIYYIYF
jgi:hypothetical protein